MRERIVCRGASLLLALGFVAATASYAGAPTLTLEEAVQKFNSDIKPAMKKLPLVMKQRNAESLGHHHPHPRPPYPYPYPRYPYPQPRPPYPPYPPYPPEPGYPRTVSILCESRGYGYNTCYTGMNYVSSINVSPVSHEPCVYGSSWGYSQSSIWVNAGCRAWFYVSGN